MSFSCIRLYLNLNLRRKQWTLSIFLIRKYEPDTFCINTSTQKYTHRLRYLILFDSFFLSFNFCSNLCCCSSGKTQRKENAAPPLATKVVERDFYLDVTWMDDHCDVSQLTYKHIFYVDFIISLTLFTQNDSKGPDQRGGYWRQHGLVLFPPAQHFFSIILN